jgi:outer membrane protein OmpA-like peptidoglycan-associated protein
MTRVLWIALVGAMLATTGPARADTAKKKQPLVAIGKDKLVLAKGISFESGTSTIHKDALPTLDATAKVLNKHKKMRLQIQVHSDSQGSSHFNRRITQERADAIAKYLTGKGIKAKRLAAKGFGEDAPIADNRKAAGRAANRRVELVILDP